MNGYADCCSYTDVLEAVYFKKKIERKTTTIALLLLHIILPLQRKGGEKIKIEFVVFSFLIKFSIFCLTSE